VKKMAFIARAGIGVEGHGGRVSWGLHCGMRIVELATTGVPPLSGRSGVVGRTCVVSLLVLRSRSASS
jgi:hypothetical protein